MTPWRNRHAVRTFAGTAVLVLVAVLVSASAQAAGHGGSRHTLPGTKPAWTATATKAATPATTAEAHAKVWLAPQNGAQLDALATGGQRPVERAVRPVHHRPTSTRRSTRRRRIRSRQVKQWLTGAGLTRRLRRSRQSLRRGLGHGRCDQRRVRHAARTLRRARAGEQAPTSDLSGARRALAGSCWR